MGITLDKTKKVISMAYLLANTVTGIWEVEELEGEDCEVLSQQEFYEALDSLENGKLIGCTADSEYCARFESEYGVQFVQ